MPLINPGESIQAAINANPNGTSFCLGSGVHSITASIVPKIGNAFTGQPGAIIDGSGWATGDDTQAAFRAQDVNIYDVTIRNLVIRNMPQKGIHAVSFGTSNPSIRARNWTVEYCELHSMPDIAISLSSGAIVLHNYIHDCDRSWVNLFVPQAASEIGYNHVHDCGSTGNGAYALNSSGGGVHWHHNYIHDCPAAAMWNDGEGTGSIFEHNTVEDCLRGIHWELSMDGIMRKNIFRRCTDQAIFISTSGEAEIYENVLEDNFRGIVYFVNCVSLTQGWFWNPDLRDNQAHDNTIRVPSTAGALACGLAAAGCPAGAFTSTPYINNTKNNDFAANAYDVPNLSGSYWFWTSGKNWTGWQAIPHDLAGSIS